MVKFILPHTLLHEKGDLFEKVAVGYFMIDLKKSGYEDVLKMYKALHEYCHKNNLDLHAVYHDIRKDFSDREILNATKRSAFQDMQKRLEQDGKVDMVLLAELWGSDCDSGYDELAEVDHNKWLQSLFYVNAPKISKEAYEKDGIPF